MRVCMIPNDMDAPGCYRCLFPGRQLAENGHVMFLPPYTQKVLEDDRLVTEFQIDFEKLDADVMVLQQRKERMWAEDGVRKLRRKGIVTVAEVDDNYLELPPYNPAFYGTHPYKRDDGVILNRKARRKIGKRVPPNKFNRNHMHEVFRQVDALTVSTPYLAELYSRFNRNVFVLRNYLDWDIWESVTPQYEVQRDRVRIGYLGVFKFRQGDLDVIKRVIPKFMRAHPEVDFVANNDAVHDYLGVPEHQRIVVPEYSFYPRDGGEYPVGKKTAVLDIGLIPLQMNGLNQAKSHLKGMEYNAAGVPFIASPTESYKDYWCDDGGNGYLAHNDHDWRYLLECLVADDDNRRAMGRFAREKASKHTYQANWREWENVYKKLLGGTEEYIARTAIRLGAIQKVSELAPLLRRVREMNPKVVVEIGSAAGGTFWALSRVAADDALLVSIDIPAGSPIDVRDGKDVYQGRNRDRMRTYFRDQQKIRLIDANSQLDSTRRALEAVLEGRKIDVLLIDGDHRYEGVKRDYELYSPLVREGGLIAFHDIAPQNTSMAQVGKLWAEIKDATAEEYVGDETWGWGKWGGVGVLVRS